MALDIPEFAVRTFEARWGHVVQQAMSKLRNKVTLDSFQGKEKVYTDLSTLAWVERTTRLSDSTPQEQQGFKRKMVKRDFKCQVIFDRKDADYIVKELSSPGSETEQAMRMSWARVVDEKLALGPGATVYGGVEPYVTAISPASGNTVAVDYVPSGSTANSGLTPWKIIELARRWAVGEVFIDGDEGATEEAYLAIGPKQKQDLYAFVQASPNNVWAEMISKWIDGSVKKLFGFNIIQTNRLALNSSTDVRTCSAWTKTGLLAVPDAMTIKIDELAEKDHAIQLSAYSDFGVMRRYEEKCGLIYCDESP